MDFDKLNHRKAELNQRGAEFDQHGFDKLIHREDKLTRREAHSLACAVRLEGAGAEGVRDDFVDRFDAGDRLEEHPLG